jgi:four helix bundle protein
MIVMEERYKRYIDKHKNINRGYRKLEVWLDAIDFYVFVAKKVRNLKDVPFKIKAQGEDSAYSVHSNISEGYCRRYIKENIQHINIALSSLGENYSQIFALLNNTDIDETWFQEFDKKHFELENKLIRYMQSLIHQLNEEIDWRTDYQIRDILEKYKTE